MVATRKRKSTRTPAKSKKVKAEEEEEKVQPEEEEEEKQEPAEAVPVKDEHTAAAEALKALSKAGEVVEEEEGAEDNASENNSTNKKSSPPAKTAKTTCVDGNCDTTESESSPSDALDPSDKAGEGKEEDQSSQAEAQPSAAVADTTTKPEPKTAVSSTSKNSTKPSAAIDPEPPAKVEPNVAAAPVPAAATPAQPPGVPSGVPVAAAAAPPVAEATIEEKGEVSALYVGRVIGRGGEMIRDLQARSGARIDVDQNVPPNAPRIITYRGTRSAIDFAKKLVALLCTEKGKDAELPLGNAIMKQVQVPGTVIGKIIGRGGEMIRKLQSESQAKIQVDHSGAGIDANHRQVTVTGTNESVVKAEEMIMFLCANPAVDAMQALHMLIREKTQGGAPWGSGPPYPNLPNQGQGMPEDGVMGGGYQGGGGYGQPSAAYGSYGGNQYGPSGDMGGVNAMGTGGEMFPCAKMHMGRVIGQKGVTINDLQKRSGCDIQINQNVPVGADCQISIKGSREGIEMAKKMLQDIIELGSNHPYAGGHGHFGGGQHGGQQSYQQPSYPGGYANQGHQPQMYSQQQYGTPQQQPYGGQPFYPQQQPYQPQGQPYGMQPGAHVPQGQSPWRAATAADGQIYYYNQITQETTWERPAGMP